MTITGRRSGSTSTSASTPGSSAAKTGSQRDEIRIVGRVSRRSYERHVRSSGVQDLIESARENWKKHHGSDPAAARLKSSAG
jgi:hypothetical protein